MNRKSTIGTLYRIDGIQYYNLSDVLAFFDAVPRADFSRYIRGKTLLYEGDVEYVHKIDVDRFLEEL